MAAYREFTPNGKLFLALALYLNHEAKKRNSPFRARRLLRAWNKGITDGILIQFANVWEE